MARLPNMRRDCARIALRLSAEDQDAIIDGTEAFVDGGLEQKSAVTQAVRDLLSGARSELQEVREAIEEQHPGALGEDQAAEGQAALDEKLMRKELEDLIRNEAPIEEIIASPALMAAIGKQMEIPQTDKLPGYGTPEFRASREFTIRDDDGKVSRTFTGYDKALDYLVDIGRGFSTKGPVRTDKIATIIIGPPASGKSGIAEQYAAETHSAIVDSDEAKKIIPEFGDGIGALAVHEESSDIAKAELQEHMLLGENMVIPKVGHAPGSIRKLEKQLHENGYTVNLINVFVTPENTFRRMIGRYLNTGRLISPTYVMDVAAQVPGAYMTLRSEGGFDGYSSIDNNGPKGSRPEIFEDITPSTGGPGPIAALYGPGDRGRPGVGQDVQESPAAESEGAERGSAAEGGARGVSTRPVGPTPQLEQDNLDEQVYRFDPKSIGVDAETFQFKGDSDQYGVTDRLSGVTEWDPVKAGQVVVYEYKDGGRFIVDGHQRLALAKRIAEADPNQNPIIYGQLLRQADGVTEGDARSLAALKNIAEGTGTAIDAAKVLRQNPKAISELPPNSALVRTARDLVPLSDENFGIVVNGVVKPNHAAVVGRLVPSDTSMQGAVLEVLSKTDPSNTTQAEAIVRQALAAGATTETQDSLFGEEALTKSLFIERAKVLDMTLRRLRKERSIFATLTNNKQQIEGAGNRLNTRANLERQEADAKATEYLQTLANRKGPLSDALTAAAERAAQEKRFTGGVNDFVKYVREAASRGDFEGAQVSEGGRGLEVADEGDAQEDGARPPETEITPEGEQGLIPGVPQVTDADRLEVAAERPLRGEAAQRPADDGIFDVAARGQTDIVAEEEAAAAEPEAPAVDKGAQRAAKRLRGIAEKMIAKAEEDAGQDRLANTARKARMAASAEADARRRLAMGVTLQNIAEAQENGSAGPLSGIKTKTQVETLDSIRRDAMYTTDRKLDYGQQQKRKGRPMEAADYKNAKYPWPVVWGSVINELIEALPSNRGFAAIQKKATAKADGPITFRSQNDVNKLIDLRDKAKKAGVDKFTLNRLADPLADLKRVQDIGIKTKADLEAALRKLTELRGQQKAADPIKEAERALVGRKIPGFFQTPERLAQRMVEEAELKKGQSILEPSAGAGRIADAIASDIGPGVVETIEPVVDLRTILENKGHSVVGSDFLEHEGSYDRIVMNPPFEKRQDVFHVKHAYDLLNPGGRVVAIMGEGPFFGTDKDARQFREWLAEVGGTSEQLPAGTFKESGTDTQTRLVIIDKAELGESLSSRSRARAGGEVGVNGYLYKGGQFLPNTMAPPGTWRIRVKGRAQNVKNGREIVAPGEMQPRPTPFSRSVYNLMGAGQQVTVGDDGVAKLNPRFNWKYLNSSPEAKDVARFKNLAESKEKFSTNDLVDLYNQGVRWIDLEPVQGVEIVDKNIGPSLSQRAFHGTPHDFDRFSTEHIGRGEGAQAFGWGLYFATRKGVAAYYRDSVGSSKARFESEVDAIIREFLPAVERGEKFLSAQIIQALRLSPEVAVARAAEDKKFTHLVIRAARGYEGKGTWTQDALDAYDGIRKYAGQNKSRLIEVNLAPSEDEYLDWDKPLSEQSEKVKAALKPMIDADTSAAIFGATGSARHGGVPDGEDIYRRLGAALHGGPGLTDAMRSFLKAHVEGAFRGDMAASLYLKELGIPGIRYLDQGSRDSGDGTHNYVIFDEAAIEIVSVSARATPTEAFRRVQPNVERDVLALFKEIAPQVRDVKIVSDEKGARDFGLDAVDEARYFLDSDTVALSLNSPDMIGNARHEIIHHLRHRGMFTKGEWNILSKEAKRAWFDFFNIGTTYDNYLTTFGKKVGAEFQVEEAIAHAFPAWSDGSLKIRNAQVTRIFKRVKRFFERLGNLLRGYGFQSVEDVFERVESGEVGRRTPGDLSRGDRAFSARETGALAARKQSKFSKGKGSLATKAALKGQSDQAKGLRDRLWSLIERPLAHYEPLGSLPDSRIYLADRYRALGKIGKIEEMAKEIDAAFSPLNPKEQREVYDYLTTRGASPSSIKNESAREQAVRVKKLINKVGDILVSSGLLSREAREANRDSYLPRIYLKHLLERGALGTSGGPKTTDLGYLKARKDIPEDVRMLILGQITDPGFLAATGFARPLRDVAVLDFLKTISQNKDWIFPDTLVKFDGREVTAHYLRSEAERIKKAIPHYAPELRDPALAKAEEMEKAALPVVDAAPADPDMFKQVPDTARYGTLRGLFVRSEIYNDVVGTSGWMPADKSVASWIWGKATRANSLWKLSKVALNPPTQVRNFVSNGVLLHLSGVPLPMVPVRVAQALKEMRTNGKHWEIAKKYGVTQSTFSNQELARIEQRVLRAKAKNTPLFWLKNAAASVANYAGDIYGLSEGVFKTAKIIDEMNRGASEENAAIEAHKWLFDYSLVPPTVGTLRKVPVGMPFLTFQYKAFPRMLEVAAKHPTRFLPYYVIPALFSAMIAGEYDVDFEDLEKLKEALPDWLRKRGNVYMLPFKDKEGRWQFLDFGYFLPWAQLWETGKSAAKGEPLEAVQSLGVGGAPFMQLTTAMQTGIDPFTKRNIANPADPPAQQLSDMMTFLWRMGAPTWLTDIGAVNKTLDALGISADIPGTSAKIGGTGMRFKGEPGPTLAQATGRFFGMNVYPIDPNQSRQWNVENMDREIKDIKRRISNVRRDNRLTKEQRRKRVNALMQERIRRIKQKAEYIKGSSVHPNLR